MAFAGASSDSRPIGIPDEALVRPLRTEICFAQIVKNAQDAQQNLWKKTQYFFARPTCQGMQFSVCSFLYALRFREAG
jgi:hypothetical protein